MTNFKKFWENFKTIVSKAWLNYIARNIWAVAYLIVANIFTSLIWRFFPHTWETFQASFGIVLILIIGLQVLEYFYEAKRLGATIKQVYGSTINYIRDIIGDVLLAYVGFFIALI